CPATTYTGPRCRCRAADDESVELCTHNEGDCQYSFSGRPGDSCTGFNPAYRTQFGRGTLGHCLYCGNTRVYAGPTGTPCRGHTNSTGIVVDGVVDCH